MNGMHTHVPLQPKGVGSGSHCRWPRQPGVGLTPDQAALFIDSMQIGRRSRRISSGRRPSTPTTGRTVTPFRDTGPSLAVPDDVILE